MSVYSFKNVNISGFLCRSGMAFFKNSKPMNSKPKPIINSPQLFRERFPENNRGRQRPIRGKDISAMLILKPKMEISQAVTVVPTLAPMITPIDSIKLNNPAFTKLTTITVVAELLWIIAVISIPVITPFTRLEVIADRIWRILLPATFCRASLINFIPKRNTPSEPISFKKSKSP